MAVSEFGALTREFYIVEIGTREIMAVSEFGRLWRGDITRFYSTYYMGIKSVFKHTCPATSCLW